MSVNIRCCDSKFSVHSSWFSVYLFRYIYVTFLVFKNSILISLFNLYCMQSLLYEKWNLSIFEMTIIGKYFISSLDYINIMKSCKKFNQLVCCYHFNPIDDYSIVTNYGVLNYGACENSRNFL